jgi:hypothetical protein
MSTYEGEHTIFGLLSQANLTQNDVLQFHPFTYYYGINTTINFISQLYSLFLLSNKESWSSPSNGGGVDLREHEFPSA